MIFRNLSNSNIVDVGRVYSGVGSPPAMTRRARDPFDENKIAEIKMAPGPTKKYVDKSGSVRGIPLAGPGVPLQQALLLPQAIGKLAYLEAQGFIPYSQCPLMSEAGQRNMPDSMKGRTDFCNPLDFGRGKKYGDHCGCPHIEEVIAIRRGDQKKADEVREEQRKSFEQLKLEEERRRNSAVFEQLAALTSAVVSGNSGTGNIIDRIAESDDMVELILAKRAQKQPHPDKRIGKPAIPAMPPEDDPTGEGDPE